MAIKNVAIIGANGVLGPWVLEALLASKSFNVTVISRASSKSTLSNVTRAVTYPDTNATEDDFVLALQSQDALVVTMKPSNVKDSTRLADACVRAGVQRLILGDFGSVDSLDRRCAELVPLFERKNRIREHVQQLAAQHEQFSWTSLVCGHFFDYGLSSSLLQFDLKAKKANIFDSGDVKWSASTLAQIGQAVVGVLHRENETRNKMMYVESLCVTQNEVLAAVEKAAGQKFAVTTADSDDFIQTEKAKMDAGDQEATEELVSVLGITRANWEGRLSNELLGLSTADLQETVSRVWNSIR